MLVAPATKVVHNVDGIGLPGAPLHVYGRSGEPPVHPVHSTHKAKSTGQFVVPCSKVVQNSGETPPAGLFPRHVCGPGPRKVHPVQLTPTAPLVGADVDGDAIGASVVGAPVVGVPTGAAVDTQLSKSWWHDAPERTVHRFVGRFRLAAILALIIHSAFGPVTPAPHREPQGPGGIGAGVGVSEDGACVTGAAVVGANVVGTAVGWSVTSVAQSVSDDRHVPPLISVLGTYGKQSTTGGVPGVTVLQGPAVLNIQPVQLFVGGGVGEDVGTAVGKRVGAVVDGTGAEVGGGVGGGNDRKADRAAEQKKFRRVMQEESASSTGAPKLVRRLVATHV